MGLELILKQIAKKKKRQGSYLSFLIFLGSFVPLTFENIFFLGGEITKNLTFWKHVDLGVLWVEFE